MGGREIPCGESVPGNRNTPNREPRNIEREPALPCADRARIWNTLTLQHPNITFSPTLAQEPSRFAQFLEEYLPTRRMPDVIGSMNEKDWQMLEAKTEWAETKAHKEWKRDEGKNASQADPETIREGYRLMHLKGVCAEMFLYKSLEALEAGNVPGGPAFSVVRRQREAERTISLQRDYELRVSSTKRNAVLYRHVRAPGGSKPLSYHMTELDLLAVYQAPSAGTILYSFDASTDTFMHPAKHWRDVILEKAASPEAPPPAIADLNVFYCPPDVAATTRAEDSNWRNVYVPSGEQVYRMARGIAGASRGHGDFGAVRGELTRLAAK